MHTLARASGWNLARAGISIESPLERQRKPPPLVRSPVEAAALRSGANPTLLLPGVPMFRNFLFTLAASLALLGLFPAARAVANPCDNCPVCESNYKVYYRKAGEERWHYAGQFHCYSLAKD